jgi:two-component system, chemotaxis family, chemotaxis protein CheY
MKDPTINLDSLTFLIADANFYARKITHSILRGFGANRILEVENSVGLLKTLSGRKIDILICDEEFPPYGGLVVTRTIRRNSENENRTVPILLMTSTARESSIAQSRDAGANMVIAKPMSPKNLYDRLTWIAFTPRHFVDTESYFGPDRRFKIEGYPGGVGRRKGDKVVEVTEEIGPALAQDDIDNLFGAARTGSS